MTIDVNGPAAADSGIFGLDTPLDDAAAVVVPVPFEATVSYGAGTARGPAAILSASRQVDLFDADVGRPYLAGIAIEPLPDAIEALNLKARAAAREHIAALTHGTKPDAKHLAQVNAAGAIVNAHVFDRVRRLLAREQLPVVIGGDHSVPYGAIQACAEHLGDTPLGILHIDAHCDLRLAYEDFSWSHASIMRNVIDHMPSTRLVQVAIRDFGDGELEVVTSRRDRVTTYFDAQLRQARLKGRFAEVAAAIVEQLPHDVYVSFDIDGLDPTLCPNTGTPVPGGLAFDEAIELLRALSVSGRRIIGIDLNEVSPGDDVSDDDLGGSWDANVGARLLYKMIGFALHTRGDVRVSRPNLPVPPGIL